MRIKCLGCEALARVIYHGAAQSPHLIDINLNRLGLHNMPGDLHTLLQQQIDDQRGKGYDYIALVYGLCGLATAGLKASDTPLVIPRAHDCITLFLGGRERYQREHERCPGTYWYVQDYIERGRLESDNGTYVLWGLGVDGNMQQEVYQQYVDKYGQDNADYLMNVLGKWQSNYRRGVYIDLGIGDGREVEAFAKQEAAEFNWSFERMVGDVSLIQRLLKGDWDNDFLMVRPGQHVTIADGDDVIQSE